MRAPAAVLILLLAASGCGRRANTAARVVEAPVQVSGVLPVGSVIAIRTLRAIREAGKLHPVVIERDVKDQAGVLVLGSGSPAGVEVADGRLILRSVTHYGTTFLIDGTGDLGAPTAVVVNDAELWVTNETAKVDITTGNVQIPRATVLTFRLPAPLRLRDFGSRSVPSEVPEAQNEQRSQNVQ